MIIHDAGLKQKVKALQKLNSSDRVHGHNVKFQLKLIY